MKKVILITAISILVATFGYAGSEKASAPGKDSQTVYRAGSQGSFKGSEEKNNIWGKGVNHESNPSLASNPCGLVGTDSGHEYGG